MRKPRKINFGGKMYKKLCMDEMIYALDLSPCIDCGAPVLEGYCCSRCGSTLPDDDRYEVQDTRDLFL